MTSMTVDVSQGTPVRQAEHDLESLAAEVASAWPVLSDERKAELGRLLSA